MATDDHKEKQWICDQAREAKKTPGSRFTSMASYEGSNNQSRECMGASPYGRARQIRIRQGVQMGRGHISNEQPDGGCENSITKLREIQIQTGEDACGGSVISVQPIPITIPSVDYWQSCCMRINKDAIMFFTRAFFTLLVMAFCMIELYYSDTCETQTLYTGILMTCVGVWLPTPAYIKK